MVVKAELNLFNNEPNLYIDAQEGEPFKLTCHPPTAWPKPTVMWLKIVNAHNNIGYKLYLLIKINDYILYTFRLEMAH